jgi:hypothetical protein
MSCGLTSGRSEPLCFDNVSGVKAVYLIKYEVYPYTSIQGTRGVEITAFPNSVLFKYETTNANFSETITNDENGINYSQSLTFTLFKQDLLTTNELNRLTNIDVRYVVEFNNGKFKMGGVYNGANLDSYSVDSGSNKASLNGYNLTFTSDEEYASPFLDRLSILTETNSFVFMDSNNFVFMDDNNYIFN